MRHVQIYIFMSSNNIVSIAACVCVCVYVCVWPMELNSLSLLFNGQTQILRLYSPGPWWRLAKL